MRGAGPELLAKALTPSANGTNENETERRVKNILTSLGVPKANLSAEYEKINEKYGKGGDGKVNTCSDGYI